MIYFQKHKGFKMEILDKIVQVAKSAYKKSILHDYGELQDDLLSILTMADRLRHTSIGKRNHSFTRENIDDTKYRDMAVIAYVLSEFGHQVFSTNLTQSQVLENLANTLNTKTTTLRNMRDFLDSYTNSPRQGWKKPLSDKLQSVYDECIEIYPPENVITKAKDILLKYKKGI